MPPAIARAPIKKAYDSVNTTIQDLNKQARNYNIKTILKVAFVITSCFALYAGVSFACYNMAGMVVPVAFTSLKEIAISILAVGITTTGVLGLGVSFSRATVKARDEFLSKINEAFVKTAKETGAMLRPLFGSRFNERERVNYVSVPCYKSSNYIIVEPIKLDSYVDIEKRYLGIQQEIRSQRVTPAPTA